LEQAGKGRTGLMVCAYLIYTGMSVEDALQLYADRRTYNNEGVCHFLKLFFLAVAVVYLFFNLFCTF
jgi:hypothetical protein